MRLDLRTGISRRISSKKFPTCISGREGPQKIRRHVRFGMIAEKPIMSCDLDGVFSYNLGITGNGIAPDYRVQEAVAHDDACAGARLEVQEQAGLPELHGPTVSTSI